MCRRRYGAASDLDQRLSTESLQGAAIEPFPFTNIEVGDVLTGDQTCIGRQP